MTGINNLFAYAIKIGVFFYLTQGGYHKNQYYNRLGRNRTDCALRWCQRKIQMLVTLISSVKIRLKFGIGCFFFFFRRTESLFKRGICVCIEFWTGKGEGKGGTHSVRITWKQSTCFGPGEKGLGWETLWGSLPEPGAIPRRRVQTKSDIKAPGPAHARFWMSVNNNNHSILEGTQLRISDTHIKSHVGVVFWE